MGADESFTSTLNYYGIKQLDQSQWQPCPSTLRRTTSTAKLNTISPQCKPITTYSSSTHPFLIDEYLVQLSDKSNKQSYFQILQWRNASENVVHYKYIKGFNSSFICEYSQKNYLYIEHIPLRLSQITDIPFPDSLYLIYSCLKGFEYLYQKFQNLEIKEEMVCLNREGRIKVWMNANLSAITPSINNVYVSIRKSEISIVNDILKMLNSNIDHEVQPKNFEQYLLQQNLTNLTFYTAIKALQRFAYLLNANIPNYLQSAYDLFNPFLNSQSMAVDSTRKIKEQTVQTKMIESIPIYLEGIDKINNRIPDFSRESKVIKYLHDYRIPEKDYWRNQEGNNRGFTIEKDMKINHQYKEKMEQNNSLVILKDYTPIYVGIDEQQPDIINQQFRQDSEQEWKYFNDDKWTEIDPQILIDLKKIKTSLFS